MKGRSELEKESHPDTREKPGFTEEYTMDDLDEVFG
jgi:hypothetical protein